MEESVEIVQDPEMPERVRRLLAAAKAWCDEEPGRQSRLARWLGVHRQAVSQWFSEYEKEHPKKQPTAEQALAIQEFLRSQKRKPRP